MTNASSLTLASSVEPAHGEVSSFMGSSCNKHTDVCLEHGALLQLVPRCGAGLCAALPSEGSVQSCGCGTGLAQPPQRQDPASRRGRAPRASWRPPLSGQQTPLGCQPELPEVCGKGQDKFECLSLRLLGFIPSSGKFFLFFFFFTIESLKDFFNRLKLCFDLLVSVFISTGKGVTHVWYQ